MRATLRASTGLPSRTERRDRWVLPLGLLGSAVIHAAVLLMPLQSAQPVGPGDVSTGPASLETEMQLVRITPVVTHRATVQPMRVDAAPIDPPVHVEPELPAPEAGPVEPTSLRRRPLSPTGGDGRLWAFTTPRPTDVHERLPAEAQLDSAIHMARDGGIRVAGVRIGLPSCDSFLTCQLNFQRGGRLNEIFERSREVEQQGALQALYRARQEAMNVRRKRRNR